MEKLAVAAQLVRVSVDIQRTLTSITAFIIIRHWPLLETPSRHLSLTPILTF